MTWIHSSGRHPPGQRVQMRATLLVLLLAAGLAGARAQDTPAAQADEADKSVSPGKSERTDLSRKPDKPQKDVEGAIGLLADYGSDYPGAGRSSLGFRPAGFLRWGRISITGAGGFTTRRNDEVERGLGAELVRQTAFRARLGLRVDSGRGESEHPRLTGLGNIDNTLLGRLSVRWDLAEGWRVGAALSTDLLNKGGGSSAELSVAHEWKLPRDGTLSASLSVLAADRRYMQTWHGVTQEQSLRSGLPVYEPQAGLRHLYAGAIWRCELSPRWASFVGGGVRRFVGPTVDSPLTERVTSISAGAGLVWRF